MTITLVTIIMVLVVAVAVLAYPLFDSKGIGEIVRDYDDLRKECPNLRYQRDVLYACYKDMAKNWGLTDENLVASTRVCAEIDDESREKTYEQ